MLNKKSLGTKHFSNFLEDLVNNQDHSSGRSILLKGTSSLLLDVNLGEFVDAHQFEQHEIKIFGKIHLQPRLIGFYSDKNVSYTYSNETMIGQIWTPQLLEIKQLANSVSGSEFNSALLNYYRDGNDSMGYHSDDEKELGPNPTIVSINLGASRVMKFKHKVDKRGFDIELNHGDVLLMAGDTQHEWKHGIMKSKRVLEPRLNITFRQIFE